MKNILCSVVCYLYMLTNINGQTISSLVFATDGQTIVAHGAISYTIGEPLIRTFDKYGYTLEEGFQRVTSVPEPAADTTIIETDNVINQTSAIAITCYPNPTADLITIDCSAIVPPSVQGSIFNMMGAVVMRFSMEHENIVQLDVSSLAGGQYMITIDHPYSADQATQVFTILK